jgi:nucleoside-diphosphate-sugar epimerase
VVRAVLRVAASGWGKGDAVNVSQDETLGLDEFLALLGRIAERDVRVVRVPRAALEARGLLPASSPFSGRWMSELDNRKSREALGFEYTPLPVYLERLVAHHRARPVVPAGYAQRARELELAAAGS